MLEPFFQWMNDLAVSKAIGESIWIYPLVQAIHLVFLALFAGALLIVDLRLMGLGMREQPAAKVARDARPWLIVGFIGLVVTGMPQLMQNAMREYFSEFFWIKMYVLPIALIYTFTIRQRIALADEARLAPMWSKLAGLVSILLWMGGVGDPVAADRALYVRPQSRILPVPTDEQVPRQGHGHRHDYPDQDPGSQPGGIGPFGVGRFPRG